MQKLRQLRRQRRVDIPPLTLTQRRIYVLPTVTGMMYASTLLLMLVGSINYNLSLGYALTFLLGGLGVVAIVHSFRNLAGLTVQPARHTSGFAGEQIHFGLQLDSQRPRPSLQLQLSGGQLIQCHLPDSSQLTLSLSAIKRGWQPMPRLTLSSSWPLGLIRAWSYVRFDEHCLVYPAPAASVPYPQTALSEGEQPNLSEPDDFFGLRPHRNTDLPQHVAWKASARLDEQLLSKQFATEQGEALWFDLAYAPGPTLEDRLSVLTRWVLDAHATRHNYGLRLDGKLINPANGREHLHACLQALALHH